MTQAASLNPRDVQKFVRSRVNASYNKQLFEEELNEQIEKNLTKMQQSILKDLKRKMIQKNQQQTQIQKRQNMKKLIEHKLSKSRQKRDNERKSKQKKQSLEKSYRKQLFEQRLSKLKNEEKQKIQYQLSELHKKQMLDGPSYNRINRAISLIEQPHYKRKIQNQQNEYSRLKKMVQSKSAFQGPNLKKRQLSLSQLRPRDPRDKEIQQERVNRMGEHLERIESTRKKKQDMVNQKVRIMKFTQQQASKLRNQRLKLLHEAQKQRQQSIISKLSKTSNTNSVVRLSPHQSKKNISKIQKDVEVPLKGSVIYEQSQQRQKYTYRKQIKQQIKQYMIKQKQKILFGH